MFSQESIQSLVDGLVHFSTDLLLPLMLITFIGAAVFRMLIYYTIKREEWFCKEFSKRISKFIDVTEDKEDHSFFIITKRLLEVTYYEVFEIRSILKRRNPDAIMTLMDRVFLVQPGVARIVTDTLRQIRHLRLTKGKPKLLEISKNVFQNNACFNKVFGIFPISTFNDILNILPSIFVIGGIFGTFLGIMKALPELGAMNMGDVAGTKVVMDNFLLKISFSMSTSIVGIILSVFMNFLNTTFSSEKQFIDTVERFENGLYLLWNMSSTNTLPEEKEEFDAQRDPVEIVAEDRIKRDLKTQTGFLSIKSPIRGWWLKDKNEKVSEKRKDENDKTKNVETKPAA